MRFERFFVLIATRGEHRFFEDEAGSVRDVRRTPIWFAGYAVSHQGGYPHVRIEKEQYKTLKAFFLEMSTRRSGAWLE